MSAPTLAFSKVAAAFQESPYKTDMSERDYKTDTVEGRAHRGSTRAANRVVRNDGWTLGLVPAIQVRRL